MPVGVDLVGVDIHSYVEVFDGERWAWIRGSLFDNGPGPGGGWTCEPFDRSYVLFGFLAGVRNHDVPQIHPCRGLPDNLSPELREKFGFAFPDDCTHPPERRQAPLGCMCVYYDAGLFGHSWATGAELVGYDFTTPMKCTYAHGDDRPTWDKEPCPHEVVDPVFTTVGEYLGEGWIERFQEIAALASDPNHVRVVYAFDN